MLRTKLRIWGLQVSCCTEKSGDAIRCSAVGAEWQATDGRAEQFLATSWWGHSRRQTQLLAVGAVGALVRCQIQIAEHEGPGSANAPVRASALR